MALDAHVTARADGPLSRRAALFLEKPVEVFSRFEDQVSVDATDFIAFHATES